MTEITLPKVPVPSFEDLTATVVAPSPPSADELLERLHQLVREASPRSPRRPGERVELGDEVVCDLLTLVDGSPIPGGLQFEHSFELRGFVSLPGFLDEILTMDTFSAKSFELQLPDDYPVRDLGGKTASFYVEVLRAHKVDSGELDDPDTLALAGLGPTIEEAMAQVAGRLDLEQGRELLIQATQAALDAFAERVTIEIPEDLVDEELERLWVKQNSDRLLNKGFAPDFVESIHQDFVNDANLRSEASFRLKTELALAALIEDQGLEPDISTVTDLTQSISEEFEVPVTEVMACLKANASEPGGIGEFGLRLAALEFIMSRVSFEIREADEV